jgi:hypothetical protein
MKLLELWTQKENNSKKGRKGAYPLVLPIVLGGWCDFTTFK